MTNLGEFDFLFNFDFMGFTKCCILSWPKGLLLTVRLIAKNCLPPIRSVWGSEVFMQEG